jgi:lysyl-tRNA synthetase class 1
MTSLIDQITVEMAQNAKAWPFEEARRLLKRLNGKTPAKGYVLFETGYGPSGLPHIGTFGEVCRTSMVRRAFQILAPEIPTRMICFSDDMDGLRKVPDNLPNREKMAEYLNKPLFRIPDPFSDEHESFAAHNIKRLCNFLDSFGFEYESVVSSQQYLSGQFDDALIRVLEKFDEIMAVMLPTLRAERQATYSPILPISPTTGNVLQVPMKKVDAAKGTVTFTDEDGSDVELDVRGGNAKLQWKPDWGMRWYALEVDYEMYGKDLIESAKLASKITRIMGGKPPELFNYELFLDEKGQKISKSKGNGLAVEDWLRYAPNESLALFMYQKPKTAKRLHFDVIPKAVDEYMTFASKLVEEEAIRQIENPAFHIHAGELTKIGDIPVSFNLLLNLASAANADSKDVLWGFINRYDPDASPEASPFLDKMTEYAVTYYQDFVKSQKQYRDPSDSERQALTDLLARLEKLEDGTKAEDIQAEIYTIGREYYPENQRDWFKAMYETLLGQSQGPRMGSFIELYGLENTREMIRAVLSGKIKATA